MNNCSILLVDDDASSIRLMARILDGVAVLRFATSGTEALRLARESVPDVILLDAEMPGMTGFQVCEAVKADPLLADVPVVFITSHAEADFEVAGFDVGAADFISKPVNPPLVLARVKSQLRVKRLSDELRRVSSTDALTGLANRRSFDDALEREWQRARRSGAPLAVLMFDVDHFKLYNDRYGHVAGDACLRSVAQAIAAASRRPADLVARYGGEEFVMLLPDTARAGAGSVAEQVLGAVTALAIPHAASPTAPYVTMSAGVAPYDDASPAWMKPSADSRFDGGFTPRCNSGDLVQAADFALYAAKRDGRAQARLIDLADVDMPPLALGPSALPPALVRA